MADCFVFIDESGVVGGVSQPVFAVGALKLADVAPLHDALVRIRDGVCGRYGMAEARFEFRFSGITRRTAAAYLAAVDRLLEVGDWEVRVLVIDKRMCEPPASVRGGEWQAHVRLTCDVVRRVAAPGDRLCVLRDAVSRPRHAGTYLEEAVCRLPRESSFSAEVFGCLLLESHASLLIQLADVVAGAVANAHLRRRGYLDRPDAVKAGVADSIPQSLGHHGDRQCEVRGLRPRFATVEASGVCREDGTSAN